MALKPITRFPLRCVFLFGPFSHTSFLRVRQKQSLSTCAYEFTAWMSSGGHTLPSASGNGLVHGLVEPKAVGFGRLLRWTRSSSSNYQGLVCLASNTSTTGSPLKDIDQKDARKTRKSHTKLNPPSKVEYEQSVASRDYLQEPISHADAWSTIKTWVVFSDLHVSRRTLETCLHVLRAVHSEASSRNAGIIFLGDFWHTRGALPVELLNLVITELGKWTCPAIFIPGNHDQVNMGGHMHALMVLGAVNTSIKVFDTPVEFLGALWLPFRRDHNLIKQALQQYPNVKAIFAHLDVVGAFMNEACQAKEGIEPALFPENIPIFTGHYHKPHVVEGTQIEYVGSPYQVSASETGQSKRLLLLNHLWEKVGSVPLDIGGRHFVISHTTDSFLENLQEIRAGDRIRLLLSSTLLQDTLKKDLETLQHRGVQVDLVFPTLTAKPRIEEAENLDAFGLFNLYAERVGMRAGAKRKGVEMLQHMDLPARLIQRPRVNLVLQNVDIQGFGPYLEPVRYPLYKRGIRVVCGKNMDSVGADSNGAGKSTLVMAPLWALSGSTDPRPDSIRGLPASDVIHEKAKFARVCVEGMVNGKPFIVERTAGRKASLKFYFDGEDRTGQDMRLTQATIDELIDTSVLQRVAFHGQYGIGGLLEASDKDFKDELGRVIAMDLWVAAKKQSLKELRSKQAEVEFLEGALTQLQQQIEQITHKVEASKVRWEEWEGNWGIRCAQIVLETNGAVEELDKLVAECSGQYQEVRESFLEGEMLASKSEQALAEVDVLHGTESLNEMAELERKKRESLLTKAAELTVEVRNCEAMLKRKRKKVDDYARSVSDLQVCDRCLQSVDAVHFTQIMIKFDREVTESEEVYELRVNELRKTEIELQLVIKEINEKTQQYEEVARDRRKRCIELRNNVNQMRKCLPIAHSVLRFAADFLESEVELNTSSKGRDTENLGMVSVGNKSEDELLDSLISFISMKDKELLTKFNQLECQVNNGRRMKAKVEQLHQTLQRLKDTSNPFEAEYNALKNVLASLHSNLQDKQNSYNDAQGQVGCLKELDTAFSHTGVQSYVLEAALAELEERTARHLEVLSGGSLRLLLRPTKEVKKSKVSVDAIDRIAVVQSSTGVSEHRSLRQLSGGERRRQALAVALGFSEFAAQRSGLHCDLLVLDEVLQHLDSEGKARVVAVLKGLPQSTILLVSQTHGDVADTFDRVDMVVKENNSVRIEILD